MLARTSWFVSSCPDEFVSELLAFYRDGFFGSRYRFRVEPSADNDGISSIHIDFDADQDADKAFDDAFAMRYQADGFKAAMWAARS